MRHRERGVEQNARPLRLPARRHDHAMRRRIRLLILRVIGALLNRPQRSRRAASSPRRVLVIKPDHLGDVLLLTPALRLLRQQLPEAEITLLIGPWSRAAVAHNPDLDAIVTCEFPGFTRADKPGTLQPYILLLTTALRLRAGRFDAALLARDDHWWGALLACIAGVPQRIGFAVPEVRPFLTTALPHSFAEHVTAQSIALVTALTGQATTERNAPRAPSSSADHEWAAAWLRAHNLDQLDGAPVIAIHPGSGGAAKLWTNQRWAGVADALHERSPIILTGGPEEQELVNDLALRMSRRPLQLVGASTIGQLAALYSRCALVLGVDSGPLHLAVTAGAPTIALFGPGDDTRFGPWGDPQRQIVLRSGLWCSPCGVLTECPRGTLPSECMALIPVQQVLVAATRLLDGATGVVDPNSVG